MAATNQSARHAEIARRYSWAAKQRKNGDRNKKPDHARLITLVRLRELERIFQSRYGRFLPDDDSGRDDLNLVAHHIAHLGGDVVAHVRGWAKAWAPWLPETEAIALADSVLQDGPIKYTADVLAWRLRLSGTERTALRITTIGSFGTTKADRIEQRKLKDRERKRAQRAKNSSGRPRGRPKKNASAAVRAIAADAFSDDVGIPTNNSEAGVTKPPADASGTPTHPIGRVKMVDGAAIVGNSNRQFKTRFPTAMRMDKEMARYALSAAFERQEVINMFETFRNWNVAMGSYSLDWRQAWFTWVDRQVEYDTERYDRERRRAYYTREVQA